MPEILEKGQEQHVFDALHSAIAMTHEGASPSEAIAKVASKEKFSREIACRMCEAFNTSKTLSVFKNNKGDEKTATFDLADPVKVVGIMYPSKLDTPAKEKAASFVPGEGLDLEQEDFHKAASPAAPPNSVEGTPPIPRDINMLMSRAYAERGRLQKVAESQQQGVLSARYVIVDGLGKLADYFRGYDHESFKRVDAIVQGHWGPDGKVIMDTAAAMHKEAGFKFERADKVVKTIAPTDREPYSTVHELMAAATEFRKVAASYSYANKAFRDFESGFSTRVDAMEKQGFGGAGDVVLKGLVLDRVRKVMEGDSPDPQKEQDSMLAEVLDPAHESQMDAISTQLLLQRLMTQDPVISRQDPLKVIDAYNQLSASYPRLASQEMPAKAYLRRMLEGGEIEPIEISEAANVEKRLTDAQPLQAELGKKVITGG